MSQNYPYAIKNESSETIYVQVGESGRFGSGVYAGSQRNGNLSFWPITPGAVETWKREDSHGLMITIQINPNTQYLFADNSTGVYTYKDGRLTLTG